LTGVQQVPEDQPLTAPSGERSGVQLPWSFDTTTVWRTILIGAFGLNALLALGLVVKLLSGRWPDAAAVGVSEALVAGFTVVFIRRQEGSRGTLFRDRVTVEPNVVFGVRLLGPRGSYPLHGFRGVEVECRAGRPDTSPNAAGPHELVWLMGQPGTPNIVLARTQDGAGRALGREIGAVLALPVSERNAPLTLRA
jgi:hypothetical protein